MPRAHSNQLLLAAPDTPERGEVASALRSLGWVVQEVSELEAISKEHLDAPGILLVATSLMGGRPEELLSEWQQRTGRLQIVLALDGGTTPDWETCVEQGVKEFVEWPLQPALLVHRLRHLHSAGGPAAVGADGWMEPTAFQSLLGDELVTASANASKVCVISAAVEVSSWGSDETQSQVSDRLVEHMGQRMLGAFEAMEGDPLGALMGAARLSRSEAGLLHMVVPGVTRLQDTAKIGARLQECLTCPVDLDGRTLDPQVGLGMAAYPEDGHEPEALVEKSTAAARRARREDSSLMVYYTEAMGRWAFERLTIERSLREAISRDELRVYYQPRVDAETRRIKGMECLVRWQHPELGLVPPNQFIPLAEETGLIVPIGEWVLREACRQNQAWRDMGLPEVAVSVNLSPVQFGTDDLYEVVMDSLQEAGLAESGLELEVTESMLMNDPQKTIETLGRFKAAGIHISIDDFGTGYSSLSYLKRFPIDALKIDRSFVMNVTTDPDDAAIATAIILMGHSLKLSVVAEGVETESQLEFLRVLQCNEIQGYLFSPPVPADRAEQLLRKEAQGFWAA